MREDPRKRFNEDQLIIDDPTRSTDDHEAALNRQRFWQARYREIKKSTDFADLFIGMWYNILLYMSGSHLFGFKRQLEKNLDEFFKSPKLQTAISAAGSQADRLLQDELTDSASVYFDTCRTDRNYGSTLFNIIKSKDQDIAAKAANQAAAYMLQPLTQIDRPQWTDMMIRSIYAGYQQAFTENMTALDKQIDRLDPAVVRQIRQILQS